MASSYVVTGMLSKGRVVRLDVPVPLDDIRVRVSIEPLAAGAARPYIHVITEIRRRQTARGHVAPPREEVDRLVGNERDSWRT